MTPEGLHHLNTQDLNERIAACTACHLCEGRTQTVPGDGNPSAELLFIGEAPGFYEDQQGRPFVGAAGRVLDQLLAEIDLTRADIFITNVVKCRPPQNRDPQPDEIASCEPYLSAQIAGIRPKMIVTLGRFAMQYFLPGAGISRTHGQPAHVGAQLIYPLYHPAAGLRNSAMREALRADFQQIPALLAQAERPAADPAPTTTTPAAETPENDATQLSLL